MRFAELFRAGINKPEKAVNRLTTRQFQTHASSSNNVIVFQSCHFLSWNCHFFPIDGTRTCLGSLFHDNPGGGEMDEGAELATAGLVVAFAAVLLVASHFFMEAQSAKRLVGGSINLKARTNIVAVRL
jgi:hypothetical protein